MNGHASALRYAAIILVALVFFMPLWWVAISALRPTDEIFRYISPLSLQSFWPEHWTLANIASLWEGSFRQAILNSLFVSALTVVIGLVICSTAAFALAVIDFPLRNAVFMIMVISFLIPFDAIAVPLFGIMRDLRLQNTYTGLILPGIGNGLAVFLLRQFFLGIPKELREAGFVDGMGWFGIYWRIYLPLSGPAMISAALILFVFQWQAYLWPLLIAPAPQLKVAAVAIAQFSGQYDVNFGLIFAAALFISVIPMVILIILQRFYSASVASSGGKE
ncbi:MAG: carbohydrate ABC transporter permease [Rhizobiaceae bacterium]